jgi:3-hydroxyisobutyrate dehydrogenase-like beta-hydroxyacid dehydrogenase
LASERSPAGGASRGLRCGIVGAGALGRAFALRLRERGHGVAVYDPAPEAAAWALERSLAVAGSPRELAARSDVVLLAVPDTPEILEALDGPDGLEAGLAPGSALLIMSTVAPETPAAVAARLAERGVAVVDAPVSGGPEAAAAGTLAIMAGGAAADVERLRPLLETLGATVVHVGRLGDGERAKLVNNLIGAVIAVAVAEGLALAARLGLDVRRTCAAVEAGSGGSWILSHWLPRTALAGDYRRRFGVDLMLKDLELIGTLAAGHGVETPALDVARAAFGRAARQGFGGADFSVLVPLAAERAGAAGAFAAPEAGAGAWESA